MFVIPAILLFFTALYIRPHEIVGSQFPLLYVGLAMAVVGLAIDLRIRALKPFFPPPVGQALWFLGWVVTATSIVNRAGILDRLILLVLLLLFLTTVAIGIQTFRMLHVATITLIMFGLFIAAVLIIQRYSRTGCIEGANNVLGYEITELPCAPAGNTDACELIGDPTKQYRCVYLGPFQTTSIDARVRYLGVLNDPNEVSMVLACFLPFAIALYEFKKSWKRLLLMGTCLISFGLVTFYSQSRGGQLVLIIVLGTYFVYKYGVRGALLGAVMGLGAMMVKGSRSAEEAAGSKAERLEVMYNGVTLAKTFPAFGVGYLHFEDTLPRAAHNSWIHTSAELGVPGLFFFILILYSSFKIASTGIKRYKNRPEARIAYVWCRAMAASIVGTCAGITFLSFQYKTLLWIQFGLYGAIYSCIKTHDPDFDCRLKLKDLVINGVLTIVVWVGFFVLTRLNPPQ